MEKEYLKGLDYEFYRFNEVNYEGQKKIYSYYLPFFEGQSQIVDLACGPGDFPLYMAEMDKTCLGVDNDPKMCEIARARGAKVECMDVLEFLKGQPSDRFDGVFSGHLIEHLTFDAVLELVKESFRILKPGGVIVLTTPNVRGLYAHLEGFYMHFGHVRFYHPRLLEFFLKQAGYHDIGSGENELMRGFVLSEQAALLRSLDEHVKPKQETGRKGFPARPAMPDKTLAEIVRAEHNVAELSKLPLAKRLKWKMRLGLAGLMTPFFEALMGHIRQNENRTIQNESRITHQEIKTAEYKDEADYLMGLYRKALLGVIEKLDLSVEAYVKGVKP